MNFCLKCRCLSDTEETEFCEECAPCHTDKIPDYIDVYDENGE